MNSSHSSSGIWRFRSTYAMPFATVTGVRSSWEMLDRNSAFAAVPCLVDSSISASWIDRRSRSSMASPRVLATRAAAPAESEAPAPPAAAAIARRTSSGPSWRRT